MYRILFIALVLFLTPLWACAQINWSNASGGNFLTATNWAGGVTPGAADDANISLAGTYTVTLGANATVNSLTINNANTTFNHTGGTLTLSSGMTLTAGTFNLSNATITGGMITGGGNRLKVGNSSILDNTQIGLNTLDLSQAHTLTLRNGASFEAGSTYQYPSGAPGATWILGTGYTLSNMTLTKNNTSQVTWYGSTNNDTVT
ncbi:MAG: hypothetical protein ACRC8S_03420, partial [Fimbriiglobus sp.]